MSDRLKSLEEFYKEDPNDPFNIYGLAIEYLKFDERKSEELFNQLLEHHPAYLPTYYHAAKFFAEKNREKAIQIYETGIEQAKRSKEYKALRELQSAFDELMFE